MEAKGSRFARSGKQQCPGGDFRISALSTSLYNGEQCRKLLMDGNPLGRNTIYSIFVNPFYHGTYG
jgi:hypothetical protein